MSTGYWKITLFPSLKTPFKLSEIVPCLNKEIIIMAWIRAIRAIMSYRFKDNKKNIRCNIENIGLDVETNTGRIN